jgi:hypothetical protein
MLAIWGCVVLFVFLLLIFGYCLDKKTDRYKRINNKSVNEGQESIKDEAQKHNPSNSNHIGPW